MKYLLDTNAWVAFLRGQNQKLLSRFRSEQPSDLVLSTIVLSELYYGAYHSGLSNISHNLGLIQQLLSNFPLATFDKASAEAYGRIREDLTVRGLLIGPNDLLIAATAISGAFTLVTHNVNEFSRIAGLNLEDWQI